MKIEFMDGKMYVRHQTGVVNIYTKSDVQQLKTAFEQDLLKLKVEIATHQVYIDSMAETKPALIVRAFRKIFNRA